MEQRSNGRERAEPGRPPPPPKPELQRALTDLESAVQRLASSAKDHFSGRAISAVEEAVDRLNRIEHKRFRRTRRDRYRGDAEGDSDGNDDEDYDVEPAMREATRGSADGPNRAHSDYRDYGYRRSRRRRYQRRGQLFRVPAEGMITGVCAGLARRWGVENWVVRCLAVTGLVFMPQIAFIAYWVLFFRMAPAPPAEAQLGGGFAASGSSAREPILGFDRGVVSAKERVRNIRAQFDGLEGRLRKLEGYVTSSRFELDRAMHEIGG